MIWVCIYIKPVHEADNFFFHSIKGIFDFWMRSLCYVSLREVSLPDKTELIWLFPKYRLFRNSKSRQTGKRTIMSGLYRIHCSFNAIHKTIIQNFWGNNCFFQYIKHCVKGVQIRSSFWSVFCCFWTAYGDLRSTSPYSVWNTISANKTSNISWEILGTHKSYNQSSKRCLLCLTEKLAIDLHKDDSILNKSSEKISKCRHRNKYMLANYDTKN